MLSDAHIQLKDVAQLRGGYAFKSRDYSDHGCFILRTINIRDDGRISRNGAVFLPDNLCDQYERFKLQSGDTLFVMVGATRGKVGYVTDADLPALLNQNMWLVRAIDGRVDKRFLNYAFRYETGKLRQWASGSARSFFHRDDFRNMRFPLPPIETQRTVAEVLGSLDDKIELNRKMNETLEELARTLFKSWFVDFDPVRAKSDGRAPAGMNAETAALFPDSFEDSHSGRLPNGWSYRTLAEVSSYLRRGLSPRYIAEGGILVVNQKCVRNGEVRTEKARRHDSAAKAIGDRELRLWDVLVNSTGVGTLGRVGIVKGLVEPAIVDSHVTVVRGNADFVLPHFFSTALTYSQRAIEALGEGSTGQTELSRRRLEQLEIVVAPLQVQAQFEQLLAPLRHKQALNSRSSETLAALRDSLLPRLLSGEVSVDTMKGELHDE